VNESSALIARLKRIATTGLPTQGDARADDAWLTQGMAKAQLHEVFATVDDSASAAGFAVASTLAAHAGPLMWLRTEASERQGGRLHATGLVEMGLDVSSLVLGLVEDEASLLRAAADAARCHGLGTLLIESWGRAPGIDLTATRRLMLAAEASGVTILSLRIGAEPVPSAAASRWQVAACRSRPLEADAPGKPAFDIELLRRRGGQAGLRWRVEWDRDAYIFDQAAFETAVFDTETGGDSAAIPGAGVSVAADRAVADDAAAFVRRTG
jgi:protein ImuA